MYHFSTPSFERRCWTPTGVVRMANRRNQRMRPQVLTTKIGPDPSVTHSAAMWSKVSRAHQTRTMIGTVAMIGISSRKRMPARSLPTRDGAHSRGASAHRRMVARAGSVCAGGCGTAGEPAHSAPSGTCSPDLSSD